MKSLIKILRSNSSLSGGERQRLLILLALIPNPELVFLDELTTGLDAKARRDVRKIKIHGSFLLFLGSWLLTMVSTLSIGLLVGRTAKKLKSASVIACILYFPMLIFSGATLPFEVIDIAFQL